MAKALEEIVSLLQLASYRQLQVSQKGTNLTGLLSNVTHSC